MDEPLAQSHAKSGGGFRDLSPYGMGRVALVTLTGTLICVAVAVLVDSFNFGELTPGQIRHALTVDVLLPLLLAVPSFLVFTLKLRDLAISRRELAVLASTDSLTAVLNRGAFKMLVESYLEKVRESEMPSKGALLVLDVDHFKSVNDRFGHDSGDEALKLIAKSIKGSVRDIDLVGRIGGEEFGVFLPGTDDTETSAIAERVRLTVADAAFLPLGKPERLSISVGAASFDSHVSFDSLFRAADERLYFAKQSGRDRVEMCVLSAA